MAADTNPSTIVLLKRSIKHFKSFLNSFKYCNSSVQISIRCSKIDRIPTANPIYTNIEYNQQHDKHSLNRSFKQTSSENFYCQCVLIAIVKSLQVNQPGLVQFWLQFRHQVSILYREYQIASHITSVAVVLVIRSIATQQHQTHRTVIPTKADAVMLAIRVIAAYHFIQRIVTSYVEGTIILNATSASFSIQNRLSAMLPIHNRVNKRKIDSY